MDPMGFFPHKKTLKTRVSWSQVTVDPPLEHPTSDLAIEESDGFLQLHLGTFFHLGVNQK